MVCPITQGDHKKLKPGLVTSYDIRSGNGEGLFLLRCFIICHLLTYLDTCPLTQSRGSQTGLSRCCENQLKAISLNTTMRHVLAPFCFEEKHCVSLILISVFIQLVTGLLFGISRLGQIPQNRAFVANGSSQYRPMPFLSPNHSVKELMGNYI